MTPRVRSFAAGAAKDFDESVVRRQIDGVCAPGGRLLGDNKDLGVSKRTKSPSPIQRERQKGEPA
jgi:hypothetical protein